MDHESSNIVEALSEAHVSTITGLTVGQLRAWDKRGFFHPRFAHKNRRLVHSRIYSFKDAVGLKTLARLKNEYRISIAQLEKVANKLLEKGYSHWADTTLYVLNKEVHFKVRNSDKIESLKSGQYGMLEVVEVIEDVTNRVIALKERQPKQYGKIENHKFTVRNAFVVSGTRIPIATIYRYLDAGYTSDQIIEEYPSLNKKDIASIRKTNINKIKNISAG